MTQDTLDLNGGWKVSGWSS